MIWFTCTTRRWRSRACCHLISWTKCTVLPRSRRGPDEIHASDIVLRVKPATVVTSKFCPMLFWRHTWEYSRIMEVVEDIYKYKSCLTLISVQCTMCRMGSFKCVRLKSDADSSKFPYFFLILKSLAYRTSLERIFWYLKKTRFQTLNYDSVSDTESSKKPDFTL